ncbi:MAG: ATP-binding protein [Halorubrum sp.]
MRTRRTQHVAALGLLCGLGLAPLAYHLSVLFSMTDLTAVVTGVLVPIACSSLVTASPVAVVRSPLSPAYTLRITGWSVLGALTLSGVVLLFVAHELSQGPPPAAPAIVIVGAGSIGSLFGLAFGLTDARQRHTQAQLERSNAQLTVLNRVLRHNIRNAMTIIGGRVEFLREHAARIDAEDARVDSPNARADTGDARSHAGDARSHAGDARSHAGDARADTGDARSHADEAAVVEESAAVVKENIDRLLSVSEHARHIDAVIGVDESDGGDGGVEIAIDLVDVVDAAIERLCAEHPDATFDGPDAETCRVRAHPLVEVVASELLENAVVHNDGDVARVDAALVRTDGDVALRIADDGPGIPDETVETIRRGYETSMRHADGLGLWLVRWVVDRSDAHLSFDSTESGQVVRIRFETVESVEGVPRENVA